MGSDWMDDHLLFGCEYIKLKSNSQDFESHDATDARLLILPPHLLLLAL